MAHADLPLTIKQVNAMCGKPLTETEIDTLLDLGEKYVNTILDASVGHLYPLSVFKEGTPEILKVWKDFMLGDDPSFEAPVVKLETYQKAMFLKAVACSKHAPIGLFRRNIFRGCKILDIGGGLGFWSSMFKIFGARPTLCDKPEVGKLVSDILKEEIDTRFDSFPFESPNQWNCIFMSEVLHGRSKEECIDWVSNTIPNMLTKEGTMIITEVDPSQKTLYAKLFGHRINIMTEGRGSAIMPHDLIKMATPCCNVAALVTWHSLPYYSVILKKR